MPNYFLFIGPLDHLNQFKTHGYVQQNYNHLHRLQEVTTGDYVVFYASRAVASDKSSEPVREFVAVGKVIDSKIKTVKLSNTMFTGTFHQMKVKFLNYEPVCISDIKQKLHFIKNKKYYGLYFISGFRELSKHDFDVIRGK